MSPSYPHLHALTTPHLHALTASGIQSAHIPQGVLGAVVVWVALMAVIKMLAALFRRA